MVSRRSTFEFLGRVRWRGEATGGDGWQTIYEQSP
jgi:hypothetical protein